MTEHLGPKQPDIAKAVPSQAPKRAEASEKTAEGLLSNKSGKLHEAYFSLSESLKDKLSADKNTISKASVKEIRHNSNLLEKSDKTGAEKAASLKNETARRLNAYTSAKSNDWYTLNYKQYDKPGAKVPHEINIGLGDILVDPDIQKIAIEKNGKIIIGTRGHNAAGRLGFYTPDGKYIATFTGDKFKILSDKQTDLKNDTQVKTYLDNFQTEETKREAYKAIFDEEIQAKNSDIDSLAPLSITEGNVIDHITKNLSPQQKSMAELIEKTFIERGLTNKNLIAAAIVNAYSESALNPNAVGDKGASVGLFQLHERGAGEGMSKTARKDPKTNINTIIDRELVRDWKGSRTLLARAKEGASIQELSALFCRYVERPKHLEKDMRKRRHLAKIFYKNSLTPAPTDKLVARYKTPAGLAAKINVASNQDTWILGSSTAYGMEKVAGGNNGVIGIVGAGPERFLRNFQETIWPRLQNLKVPKQVVLVGMAVNGLRTKGETAETVQRNLEGYKKIIAFLESKGISNVKIATLQPYQPKIKQIQAFNDAVRKENHLDIAKHITTPDGKKWASNTAAGDNLHMNTTGKRLAMQAINESLSA